MRFFAPRGSTRIKAMSIPLVAAALVALGGAVSAARAPAASAASGAVASFTYGLDRLSTDSTGAVIETNFDHVDESLTSPVQLNACSSSAPGGIATYQWSFGAGAGTLSTTSCNTTWRRPVTRTTASRYVTLKVVPADPAQAPATVVKQITFRDVVIASLGDSAASGEGAPERWAPPPTYSGGYVGAPFQASEECDRSGWAASAQAALTLQRSLPDTTVHLWHLACSGATISSADSNIWPADDPNPGGLISPYKGSHGTASLPLPPQVDRLAALVQQSGLPVDRLLITAGINELHWASIAKDCESYLGGYAQLQCFKNHQAMLDMATATLPGHFAALAGELRSLVAPRSVYLTEYFDPVDSLSGSQPWSCADPAASWWLRTYATGAIMNPIETIVSDAAAANGWNFIGGIRAAFQGHGACSFSARWVNTSIDSLADQGNLDGTWHANRTGQTAIAPILFDAIKPGLMPPVEVAFEENTNNLWTVGADMQRDWGLGMMAGTSSSITALANGGYEVAFQANTGNLWTVGSDQHGDWGLGMMRGTSPSITALANDSYEIAFQANTGNLWTVGFDQHGDWGLRMNTLTSPAIARQ